jgi:hypothetical protein
MTAHVPHDWQHHDREIHGGRVRCAECGMDRELWLRFDGGPCTGPRPLPTCGASFEEERGE